MKKENEVQNHCINAEILFNGRSNISGFHLNWAGANEERVPKDVEILERRRVKGNPFAKHFQSLNDESSSRSNSKRGWDAPVATIRGSTDSVKVTMLRFDQVS